MRLIYTEMQHSLTEILTNEAYQYVKKGYRVFYIAPNSLSFEKEREVLGILPEHGSFDITITRFEQMARYFTLNQEHHNLRIDDTALSMLFYRALMQLQSIQLPVYSKLKQDMTFISQLVELYKELLSSNLTIDDLVVDNPVKKEDLATIFSKVNQIMVEMGYTYESSLSLLRTAISKGQVNQSLEKTVIIIDGFTRFSAEEDLLVDILNQKAHELVIGTYASQKSYKSNLSAGSAYQASLDFLTDLRNHYQVRPEYAESSTVHKEAFKMLSQDFESKHDYSLNTLSAQETSYNDVLEIWQARNQKEEIELVAKSIRQKLYEGFRYKDIIVLVGDVESYDLQIGPIFDKYEIPYYLGRSESMTDHPLVQFVDSLERCKKYNWRRDDIINLMKSHLFGHFSQKEVDQFEKYLQFADINGFTKFSRDFTVNHGDGRGKEKYDLVALNKTRESLFEPLNRLFKAQVQLGSSLLNKLMVFFQEIALSDNIEALCQGKSEAFLEKQEQVWNSFVAILTTFEAIFRNDKLSVIELLELIKVGLQSANYRVIPATVDVVSVKSYELIEPHSKPLVYAIGMTQTYFPKRLVNKSLLNDHERSQTNESQDYFHRIPIASIESQKKSLFTALSLLNAATKKLIISYPLVLNESPEDLSPYVKELVTSGIEIQEKEANNWSGLASDIGNYKSLLTQLVDLQNSDFILNNEEENFWTVMTRYLKKRLKEDHFPYSQEVNHLETKAISQEVLAVRFPKDKPISLSSSALSVFNNNQYKYFIQYVLGLQEQDSIHPDARHHGNYLHKVFETVLADHSALSFDQKLEKAIEDSSQLNDFKFFYQDNAQSQFSLEILKDIARATSGVLKVNQEIETIKQEEPFTLSLSPSLKVKGLIDRIDQLPDKSLGIVDYKSSSNKFDIDKFYNGLNSQLVTYLDALTTIEIEDLKENQFFGAMYLHMQEPKLDLKKYKTIDSKLQEAIYADLTYKGIFLDSEKENLSAGAFQTKNNLYSLEEIEVLKAYNRHLFLEAERSIRGGHFLINPYTEDGKSVQGDQLKAITRFESDLDLGQARRLLKLPSKDKRKAYFQLMSDIGKGGN